jgi:hypothetical protein
MKQSSFKVIAILSASVIMLAGCKNTAEETLTTSSPAITIIAAPSVTPISEASAAPTFTPVPELTALYPYYVTENKKVDLESHERSNVWGYMDRSGHTVLQPAFSSAEPFNAKGVAIVRGTGKASENYGLIDQTGKYILELKYKSIIASESIFAVMTFDNHSFLVGDNGHIIKPDIPGEIGTFTEGKASIKFGELYGFIDQTGEIVVKPQYNYVQDFQNGKALVHVRAGQDALLNEKGEQIHTYNVQYIDSFSEGLAATRLTENSKFGFINEEGELIIAEKYETADSFHEGLAVVSLSSFENQTGLINTKGDYVLQPQFGEIVYLGKSLWAVSQTTRQMAYDPESGPLKFALYNAKGEKISDYVFDDVQPFLGNYAVVQQGVSSFLIDGTGHKSKDWPVVEGIGELKVRTDLLEAYVDNELKYINAQRDVIWQDTYAYDLGDGVVLKEAKYRPNRHVLSYYPIIEGLKNKTAQDKLNQLFKQGNGAEYYISDEQGQNDFDQSFSIIMHQKDLLIVNFSSYSYTGGAHGMPGEAYYHLNLQTGEVYALKDLFKPDSGYISQLNQILHKLIKEQGKDKGVFEKQTLGFDGITEDHLFYIQAEALHIVFNPYEIGP